MASSFLPLFSPQLRDAHEGVREGEKTAAEEEEDRSQGRSCMMRALYKCASLYIPVILIKQSCLSSKCSQCNNLTILWKRQEVNQINMSLVLGKFKYTYSIIHHKDNETVIYLNLKEVNLEFKRQEKAVGWFKFFFINYLRQQN